MNAASRPVSYFNQPWLRHGCRADHSPESAVLMGRWLTLERRYARRFGFVGHRLRSCLAVGTFRGEVVLLVSADDGCE